MSDTGNLSYPLTRDWLSSARLNLNHFWMNRLTGYHLHPKIDVDKTKVSIADLGAGTGIWASELASELPTSAVVDAFDISADQFPPVAWRGNVNFKVLDCFKPIPEEYHEKYDVVNLRFWLCIVNDDSADRLLNNILTLLKPGGYIQWFEPLPHSARVVARNNGQPTPGCDQLVKQWNKPAEHSSYNWVMNLPGLLTESEVIIVAEEKFNNPDYYQSVASQSWMMGYEQYISKGKDDSLIAQQQRMLIEETAAGAYVDVAYTLVVGRKKA